MVDNLHAVSGRIRVAGLINDDISGSWGMTWHLLRFQDRYPSLRVHSSAMGTEIESLGFWANVAYRDRSQGVETSR